MGIKGFTNIIIKTFNCIQKPKYLDTLCIDVNSILHIICHKSNQNNFSINLIRELKKLLEYINQKIFILIYRWSGSIS